MPGRARTPNLRFRGPKPENHNPLSKKGLTENAKTDLALLWEKYPDLLQVIKGGLNAGEIDVGFGSEEDIFDRHLCFSARETRNLRSLNAYAGLSHGLKCRQLKNASARERMSANPWLASRPSITHRQCYSGFGPLDSIFMRQFYRFGHLLQALDPF